MTAYAIDITVYVDADSVAPAEDLAQLIARQIEREYGAVFEAAVLSDARELPA